MRNPATREAIKRFISGLSSRVKGPGRIYLVGGATAVLHGWRESTIDIDLKADPEPPGFFEAIANLKDELSVNVELASPDHFLPELPGWHERSPFIVRDRELEFYHFDPYSQALAKLERGHPRDLVDLAAFSSSGQVDPAKLRELFAVIRGQLIRFPGVDAASLAAKVEEWKP
jgi:hypothetical protein